MFNKKTWFNRPNKTTPIDAEGMNDLENRIENEFENINNRSMSTQIIVTDFQNGFRNYTSNRLVTIHKRDKLVTLTGLMAIGTQGAVAFNIPVGFRPSEPRGFTGLAAVGASRDSIGIVVENNGNVTPANTPHSWVYLDQISYYID